MNASIGYTLFTKILEEIIKWSAKKGAENWLDNDANRQALADAASLAGDCIASKPIDQKITLWLADLKMSDILNMAEAIERFRVTANYHTLAEPIRVKLRERGDLSPEEIEQGVDAFVTCLRQSLLSIEEIAHPAIGSLIIDAEKNITEQIGEVKDLVKDIPGEVAEKIKDHLKPPLSEYTPPPPPPPGEPAPHVPLPPGSRLPLTRNEVFTGRERQLGELADRLLYNPTEKAVGITEAMLGMGGIGKTQLAVEFCHRYGAYFKGVHWLNVPAGLDAEAAACGAEMGLPNWPTATPEQAALTLHAWAASPPRLIILDNLDRDDAPEVLAEWLPKLRGQRVLVTSRRVKWPAHLPLEARSLETFTLEESRALLRRLAKHLNKADDGELDEIHARFDGLPLAVDLAGRYLAEMTALTPQGYLEELEDEGLFTHPAFVDWAEDKPEKERCVAASFLLSWKELKEEKYKPARLLFQAAGHCAPNVPIPDEALEETLRRALESEAEKEAPRGAARALRRLRGLGLLALDEETGQSTIHPLLAEYARLQEEAAGEERALPSLAGALATLIGNANETGFPANAAPLRPHCQTAAPRAAQAGVEDAGTLWNNLGYHLRMVAEYAAAEDACQRALAIDEAALGPDHPDVAIFLNNLGEVLHTQGDLAGARENFQRALAIGEKTLGPDHPKVANRLNNLGAVLRAQRDLAGAREHYQRALTIGEKTLGPDHPKVAIRLNNLGSVLQAQGDLEGAMEHYQRALAIDEAALGSDHPNVAIDLNNLGLVLKAQGDLAGAREHYQRALEIGEKTLGPDHPDVAIRLNNLGGTLHAQSDLEGAREHYQRALSIWEKALGENHPRVAIGLNNLGLALQAQGDLAGAREHYQRALAIDEAALGPDHPKVAIRLNNLGDVLHNQGDLPGARDHHERALAIRQKALPENHPDIAQSLRHLGGALQAQGDLAGAREHIQRALRIFEASLPEGHPNIEGVRRHLAIVEAEIRGE